MLKFNKKIVDKELEKCQNQRVANPTKNWSLKTVYNFVNDEEKQTQFRIKN